MVSTTAAHTGGTGPDTATVDTVVFDLGGVLTEAPFRYVDTYSDELGLPGGTLSGFFRGDEVFSAVERGEVSFRDFLKSVGVRVQERHGLRIDLHRLAHAAESAGHLNPEMMTIVGRLHAAGLRLGLLTNNVKEATIWREELPADLFHAVLDSSALGLRKPDPRLYRIMLDRMERAPHQVVYVDDFAENLPPAVELGIRVVHFRGVSNLVDELELAGLRVARPGSQVGR